MTDTQDRTFSLTRIFDAPRELVFAAFSECEHLKHWWSPEGWTLPVCEMDFREGGSWFYCMQGEDKEGKPVTSCGKANYETIKVPGKIIYTDNFTDNKGKISTDMPSMHITVTFDDEGGKTRVTSETMFATKAQFDQVLNMGMEQGVKQTWDKLEDHLANIGN